MASSMPAYTSPGVLVASVWSVVGLSLSPVFLPAQDSEVVRATTGIALNNNKSNFLLKQI